MGNKTSKSVAIYIMSEKKNNIIAVWLLALKLLLKAWACGNMFDHLISASEK